MDELTLRYREACEQDDRRPSDSVREAVHAHARMMIAARGPNGGQPEGHEEQTEAPPAANQSRWKMSLLASVAIRSRRFSGLLGSGWWLGKLPSTSLNNSVT